MSDATWGLTGEKFGAAYHPRRRPPGHLQRAAAMRALGAVVYAARLADGTIKIGWTEHFDQRMHWLKSHTQQDVELLAFRAGPLDAEQAIHAQLAEHIHHGREYYNPTTEVLAVINDMRASLTLPPIAASTTSPSGPAAAL